MFWMRKIQPKPTENFNWNKEYYPLGSYRLVSFVFLTMKHKKYLKNPNNTYHEAESSPLEFASGWLWPSHWSSRPPGPPSGCRTLTSERKEERNKEKERKNKERKKEKIKKKERKKKKNKERKKSIYQSISPPDLHKKHKIT